MHWLSAPHADVLQKNISARQVSENEVCEAKVPQPELAMVDNIWYAGLRAASGLS